MIRTTEAAQGRWFGILTGLGIDKSFLRDQHGPCPVCGGSDRFRFDNREGRGTYFCNHCGAGDGMKLAIDYTGLSFPECAAKIDSMIGNVELDKSQRTPVVDQKARLERIKLGLVSAAGDTPVTRYLSRRGLDLSPALRLHPSLPYWEKQDGKPVRVAEFPAMVAAIQLPSGQPVSYHITYLNSDGTKAGILNVKKIMTPMASMDGAAIRLSRAESIIGLAEGIETALAVQKEFGLPCWAAANSILMEKFEPPAGVESVRIFADNDKNYEGQRAAYSLAKKLSKSMDVEVLVPRNPGTDFADYLHKKAG